jgi:hypothetical protein
MNKRVGWGLQGDQQHIELWTMLLSPSSRAICGRKACIDAPMMIASSSEHVWLQHQHLPTLAPVSRIRQGTPRWRPRIHSVSYPSGSILLLRQGVQFFFGLARNPGKASPHHRPLRTTSCRAPQLKLSINNVCATPGDSCSFPSVGATLILDQTTVFGRLGQVEPAKRQTCLGPLSKRASEPCTAAAKADNSPSCVSAPPRKDG